MTPAKCPNPACPFLFDPSQVPPGAIIACPQCGLRFTLAPPAAPSPPLYGTTAPAVSDDDLGLAEVRPNLDDMPTEERPKSRRRRPAEGTDADGGEKADRHPKAGSGAGKLILFSVLGVLLVCGLIVGVLFLNSRNKARDQQDPPKNEVVLEPYHIAYTPAAGNWVANDALKKSFKATVMAVESQEPLGWIVVDVKAMAYTPTPVELHDMVRATLDATGEVKGRLEEEAATLGGVPAKRYVFESRLTSSGEDVKGEVYAVGYQKSAYFIYSFAPEKKVGEVAQTFVDFRAKVRFLTKPSSKGDTAGFRKVYRTKQGAYALTATENLWKELSDPASRDDADLWLTGTIAVAAGGARPDPASVYVWVLDKAGDAAATAKAHLTDKVYAREGATLMLTELTDGLQGDDPPAGAPELPANLTRYEVRYANDISSSRKYVVVATMEADKKVIVAAGEASLKQRMSWEKRLVQIIGSLASPQ